MRKVSTVLENPKLKVNSVRFDSPEESDPVMKTAYVTHDALLKIGNPTRIKITIEAA